MNQARVILETRDEIAYVTLNRPEKRNALDMAMFRAIDDVSRKLRNDRRIRAVIVTGAGEDFCSGLDIKSVMSDKTAVLKLLRKWLPGNANLAQRVSYNWRKIPVPVIMVIHGRCWGGGMQIALGADFRLANPDASLSVMEGKWGLIPDMAGNLVLREIVGKDIAMRLSMSAEVISARKALDLGLITEITEDPLKTAEQLAADLTERSPDAIAAIKKLYHRNWFRSDAWMLAKESYYQLRILLGRNQSIAVNRQLDPDKSRDYLPRKRW